MTSRPLIQKPNYMHRQISGTDQNAIYIYKVKNKYIEPQNVNIPGMSKDVTKNKHLCDARYKTNLSTIQILFAN